MSRDFYSSDAVIHPISDENRERTFAECLRSDQYASIFIIECDGAVAGYALTALHFSQEMGGLVVWIEELYIKESFRGRGLGGEFFDYIEKNPRLLSSDHDIAGYRLECEYENDGAMRLYKRRGYTELGYVQLIK